MTLHARVLVVDHDGRDTVMLIFHSLEITSLVSQR